MPDDVIPSLREAKAVFRKHAAEQKEAGRRKTPDAWLSLSGDRLVIVVHGENDGKPIMKPYEYDLEFQCKGVHEITAPRLRTENDWTKDHRKKKEPQKVHEPPKQLHMFRPG